MTLIFNKFIIGVRCERKHVKTRKRDLIMSVKVTARNEKLLEAKERLILKGFKNEFKKDMDNLLLFVRPETMSNDVFRNECYKVHEKYLAISKQSNYDVFESEIIFNSASQVLEFMFKAYLTMCYYN